MSKYIHYQHVHICSLTSHLLLFKYLKLWGVCVCVCARVHRRVCIYIFNLHMSVYMQSKIFIILLESKYIHILYILFCLKYLLIDL